MNTMDKKFVSLFLVFSLVMLSVNLYAQERRGAEIIVTKKVGRRVEGELITVKENSLLILNTEGKDVSVNIEEIKRIEVKKKSKFWTRIVIGGGIGSLIGGGIGVAVGLASHGEYGPTAEAMLTGLAFGSVGSLAGVLLAVLIGAIADTHARKYKTIQIEGMTDSEIQKTLNKLRKKARICEYK